MLSTWYKFAGFLAVVIVTTSYIGCSFNTASRTLVPKPICTGFDWITNPENLERIEHIAMDAIVEGRVGKFIYNDGVIRITDSPISFHLHGNWVIVKNPISPIHGVGLKNGPCGDHKYNEEVTYRQIDVDETTKLCLCTGECLEALPEEERRRQSNPFDSLRFLHSNFQFIQDLVHHTTKDDTPVLVAPTPTHVIHTHNLVPVDEYVSKDAEKEPPTQVHHHVHKGDETEEL
jgi:hypothetical protein